MSFSIFFYLDNRWDEPPVEAQRMWVHLLDAIDDMKMQLRLPGFERLSRVVLTFCSGNLEVRHVYHSPHVPLWTTPIQFSIERKNQHLFLEEIQDIKAKLEHMMHDAVRVPQELDNVAVRSHIAMGIQPTRILFGDPE